MWRHKSGISRTIAAKAQTKTDCWGQNYYYWGLPTGTQRNSSLWACRIGTTGRWGRNIITADTGVRAHRTVTGLVVDTTSNFWVVITSNFIVNSIVKSHFAHTDANRRATFNQYYAFTID
jgi:hypothetical protein